VKEVVREQLLRAARDGDEGALGRMRRVRCDAGSDPRPLNLADAQLAIAREGSFESWPKLVAAHEEQDVKSFCDAVTGNDVGEHGSC
jgi:hypothetical protein